MRSQLLSQVRNWMLAFLYPKPLLGFIYLPRYIKNWVAYNKMSPSEPIRFMDAHPCLADWRPSTPFDPHYLFQGAWLARHLQKMESARHFDVGSSVMMVSVLSAVAKTVFVDFRPLNVRLTGLFSIAGNITCLPFKSNSIKSLSSLHVIEHIGLGRYGDHLDPEGSIKAAKELERVLAPGGMLYLSLPVGRQRVCFNAHRIISPTQVLGMFAELDLHAFSFVDDEGNYHEKAKPEYAANCSYGCGMYVFRKSGSC